MIFSQKEIEFGYWNRFSRQPHNLDVDDERIFKVKDLGINLSEADSATSKKKWIAILPKLQQVENLWIHHRLNEEMFYCICRLTHLKGLNIKHSGIKVIDSIVGLNKLEHLNIGSSPSIQNIEALNNLEDLKTLSIENFKNVTNIEPLSAMTNLIGLGLNGGMYSRYKIDSLKPISNLVKLKYLQLVSVTIQDKSIRPLLNLKQLESLRITNPWDESDFELLRKNLPLLKYGNVVPDKNSIALSKIFSSGK